MSGLTEEAQKKLRAPFPPEMIGRIPKGGTQLEYVGHAAVTDRLLEVDPNWSIEPMSYDDQGLPAVRVVGGDLELWVKLTVCGVTRYEVGVEPMKGGKASVSKQLWSDALKRAAMRFGVALDLWSKEELIPVDNEPSPPPPSEAHVRMVELAKAAAAACGDPAALKAELFGSPEFEATSMVWSALIDLPQSVAFAAEFFADRIAECEETPPLDRGQLPAEEPF